MHGPLDSLKLQFLHLCDLLKMATGVKVGKSTMGRITQKLNYSQKKDIISTMEENLEVPHKRV